MPKVLDAHGLMIFLEKETGYEKVDQAFTAAVEKNTNLLMTTVNWGEVLYIVLRECGKTKAQEIEKIITMLPIDIVDVDIQIAREAARFKVRGKLSYADCFSVALAKLRKAEILTGDKEFKSVESEIKINWL